MASDINIKPPWVMSQLQLENCWMYKVWLGFVLYVILHIHDKKLLDIFAWGETICMWIQTSDICI